MLGNSETIRRGARAMLGNSEAIRRGARAQRSADCEILSSSLLVTGFGRAALKVSATTTGRRRIP